MGAHNIVFESFVVPLTVVIRTCRREDMEALEWFGMFAEHREIIRAAFNRHARGEAVMLVAEANGNACGQVWIDLDREYVDSTAVLWAIRVFPCLQNLGIGTRLIQAAESLLRARMIKFVEMTVEKSNKEAKRLYERLGYHAAGELHGAYTNRPDAPASVEQWIFRKDLRAPQL